MLPNGPLQAFVLDYNNKTSLWTTNLHASNCQRNTATWWGLSKYVLVGIRLFLRSTPRMASRWQSTCCRTMYIQWNTRISNRYLENSLFLRGCSNSYCDLSGIARTGGTGVQQGLDRDLLPAWLGGSSSVQHHADPESVILGGAGRRTVQLWNRDQPAKLFVLMNSYRSAKQ